MNKLLLLIVLSTTLTGCSLKPDYVRPGVKVPPAWSHSSSAEAMQTTQTWWKTFGSDELNSLMVKAFAGNLDLKASVQRVEQARASMKAARSGLFPTVNANAGAGHTHEEGGDTSERWNGGTAISYEIDLFGAAGSAADAGAARLAGSAFTHDALRLIVMGDVAQTYFNVLAARERYATANRNVENAENLLKLIQARFEAGADSALEVAQQTAALESSRATRASLEATVKTAENALAILLGEPPQTIEIVGAGLEKLHVPAINAGIPSSLLDRRPDIRAAVLQAGLPAHFRQF